jgi:hypothetical protein
MNKDNFRRDMALKHVIRLKSDRASPRSNGEIAEKAAQYSGSSKAEVLKWMGVA